jgi:GNAT superfamily N-acetyltransferase
VVTIRDALPADVPAMARVHVESRRTAFARVLPPEVADAPTIEERLETWREFLARPDLGSRAFALVAVEEGEVVGVACGGGIPVDEPGYLGEVIRLYVATPSQGHGVGRALLLALAGRLATAGLEPFLVWTPSRNEPARRFYERLGGRLVREALGVPSRVGIPVDKIAYGWDRAPALRSA